MLLGEQMANTSRAALLSSELRTTASELQQKHHETGYKLIQINHLEEIFPQGIRRGATLEITGARSSGRLSVSLPILVAATGGGEVCAVVDLHNSFDPAAAVMAGVQLERMIWVRCGGNIEHAIRATDLLLHAGGFGVVALDLCEANALQLNRIPLSYWHRFRRAIEHTPTVLLVIADSPQAKASSGGSIHTKRKGILWSGSRATPLLEGLEIYATAGSKVSPIRAQPLFFQTVA